MYLPMVMNEFMCMYHVNLMCTLSLQFYHIPYLKNTLLIIKPKNSQVQIKAEFQNSNHKQNTKHVSTFATKWVRNTQIKHTLNTSREGSSAACASVPPSSRTSPSPPPSAAAEKAPDGLRSAVVF